MWKLLKPFLFQFDAEKVHHTTMQWFKAGLSVPFSSHVFPPLGKGEHDLQPKQLMGLTFPNPLGLAAGFDKDGKYFDLMSHLGFGFVEIGTVTPEPQEGNPKPRIFRLPEDEALINRLGFNNEGVEACVQRLKAKQKPRDLILGGNIGKNKWTPNDEAHLDYEICFERLFPYVDYFVVNVSSPNTPGLRELQEKGPLKKLLSHIQDLNHRKEAPKPILLKVAPDLSEGQLKDCTDIVQELDLPGMIISNTTISRKNIKTGKDIIEKIGDGGVSGAPLFDRSTSMLRMARQLLGEEAVLIGVGGIHSLETAKEKLDAGADLIQMYTGLIYEGPGIVRHILKGLRVH